MKCYLRNYHECICRFGKSTADAILRQVKELEVEPVPNQGDILNCNGKFTLRVEMVSQKVIHVTFDKVI